MAAMPRGRASSMGRHPDGTAGAAAGRRRGGAGGQRRGRATARSAGDPPGRGRLRYVAVVRVLRRGAEGELVQVGLADGDVTGGLEQTPRVGGSVRDVVPEDRRAVGGADAGGVEEVLDGELDPVRGAVELGDEDAGGGHAG